MTEKHDNSQMRGELPVLHFLERIAAVETPYDVLTVVQDYLHAWPKERVANLQRVDGGWGPFDRDQNPLPVNTLGKLALFQEAIHRQCLVLSMLKLQSTPEIMELDEMLTTANQFANAAGTADFDEVTTKLVRRTAQLTRR